MLSFPRTLEEIQSDIQSAKYNLETLVCHYLEQIEKHKALNIYINVYQEEILQKARALDEKYKSAPHSVGRLYGMVISIKDVICYKDHPVTGASKILEGFESLYTATALQRLLEEDALVIGNVNCDEFGMGSANQNSIYGPTLNGIDPNRIPGGSSGASAVAVQMETCLISLGSDTGGSVRQPAALCGIVGMKPSYGRISRYGLLAYASSFDQIGILSSTTKDAALALEIMAGKDPLDATSSTTKVSPYAQSVPSPKLSGLQIAYFDIAFDHPALNEQIRQKSYQLLENLKTSNFKVTAEEFDYLSYLVPAYYVLTTAEASTNLSRYDGIRFGYRSPRANTLEETYTFSRTEGFGEEVKRRILLGTFVLSAGYNEAYYKKAQKVRRKIKERMDEVFEKYDALLMPVTTNVAGLVENQNDDPIAVYLADVYTVLANMCGVPAITLPLGKNENGLPFGIQVLVQRENEMKLFSIAQSIEKQISTL